MFEKRYFYRFKILPLLFFLILVLVQCTQQKDPWQDLHNAQHYLNLHDTVNYVGMLACKECHYANYESYLRTGMGQSFDSATRQKSAAVISDDSVLYDYNKNLFIKPFWQNDSLMVMEYRLDGNKEVYRRTEYVNYVVGSGHHTNSHIFLSEEYAYQAPFTYYTQDGMFDLPPGFEDGRSFSFTRKIGLECMSCHNGFPKLVLGSENKYTHIADGIDCERCHGPGEVHVALKRRGFITDTSKYIDYSIVNPSNLSTDRQVDICARCHLQGTMVLQEGKSFYDFKPGMDLDTVMDIFMPLFAGGREDFIMASHYERMVQSKCFLESEGNISCTQCHNPHVSVKETPSATYNKVCLSCHGASEDACGLASELRKNQKNDCVSCHIRLGYTRDIPHVTTHDHKISIPPSAEDLASERVFLGLFSVNNPNTSAIQKARGYLLEYESFHPDPNYLDSAWYYLQKTDDEMGTFKFNTLVNYYFLKKEYVILSGLIERKGVKFVLDSLLTKQEYSNYDAWTSYRIGQAYERNGNSLLAGYFYQKAVKLAPYILEFQLKYGTILVTTGKLAEAMSVFQFVLKEDPNTVSAYVNMGYLSVRSGKTSSGEEYYKKALSLDPDHIQALLNLSALYLAQGKKEEGMLILNSVLKQDTNNQQAKKLLD